MKQIILTTFFLIMAASVFAQEQKAGCSPQSCGPENTKVGEAAILTELRSELVGLKLLIKEKGLIEESVVKSGTTDDESLQIMISEVNQLSKLMKMESPKYSGNSASIVRSLQIQIKELKSSID